MKIDDVNGLTFSDYGLSNRALFLDSFNDVIIYVEDVGKEYEYEEIFERLFANEIKIFSIFPLGGKDAVIQTFYSRGTHTNGKANIYIIDGDFDNLWEDQKILSSNLIYLTRYNIEAYYCSKDAVARFMRALLKHTRSTIEEIINFDEWKNVTCRRIGDLFILFATVKRYCPEIPNVGLGIGEFIDANGSLINDNYMRYFLSVKERLTNLDDLITELSAIVCGSQNATSDNVYYVICGKYQFESLCRRLKFYCGKNINRGQFRAYLVSNFDLSPLEFLRDNILRVISDEMLTKNNVS